MALQSIPGPQPAGTAKSSCYEAVGSYHAFNTCNLWTNRVFKQIGVKTALWSPFTKDIVYHLD
jgi:hypothetical protein